MDNKQGFRLQRVRDFTVQIRHPTTEEIVGTGIIVSPEGKVVSCAHVVEAALGVHPRDAGDMEVGIYYPLATHDERKLIAKVAGVFPQHDDDIVLLKVTGPLSLTPNQIAVLGVAELSQAHKFQGYGYRRLDDYLAGWAEGTIQGPVEAPERGTFMSEPVQLLSSQINRGMSGAAVLDKERNLVVGLISETWFPDQSTKDRDTAWAVDARVLSFEPLSIPLRDESLPLLPGLHPRAGIEAPMQLSTPSSDVAWNMAPDQLSEWVGRQELLRQLTEDWTNAQVHTTGLVGFGGEGKSCLARRWIDEILQNPEMLQPDGVFWWGFSDRPDVDEFFNALLEYIAAGKIDPTKVGSATAKAQFVGAMLGRGRYLFILDGIEVMQYQEGDRYGELVSPPLLEFLTYVAAPDNTSFAVVTSRVQLHDLASYTSFHERNVDRLTTSDGLELLRMIGVKGPENALVALVDEWEGHALTLSLLGTYLSNAHQGDVSRVSEIPAPTEHEHIYDRVHRVLRRYDQHLSEAEKTALMLISPIRGPVNPTVAYGPVVSDWSLPDVLDPIKGADKEALTYMIHRLLAYRIMRYDERREILSVHPLIRSHYRARLKACGVTACGEVHRTIAGSYMAHGGINLDEWEKRSEKLEEIGSLEELHPAIEAVYHYCAAGDYKMASDIDYFWINRALSTNWISVRLGAHETALDVILNFFPGRNQSNDPELSELLDYLNAAGVQLRNLGRADDAISLFKRVLAAGIRDEKPMLTRISARNLCKSYSLIGNLSEAARAADETLRTYGELSEEEDLDSLFEWSGDLAHKAWIAALRGDIGEATTLFDQAEQAFKKFKKGVSTLLGGIGIDHAEYLYRNGDLIRAAKVLEQCQAFAELLGRVGDEADSHRLLGMLWAQLYEQSTSGNDTEAFANANTELNLAVSVANKSTEEILINALTARGSWAAKTGDVEQARQDLQEALDRSSAGGFRLKHADALTGLAWLHITENRPDDARNAAQAALSISHATEYGWGQQDAEDALAALIQEEKP